MMCRVESPRRADARRKTPGLAVMADVSYNSRIDAGFIVLAGLLLSALFLRGLMSLRFDIVHAVLMFAAFAFVVLMIGLVCYPCRYDFEDDHLLVQSGALRMRVDYADITAIALSGSLRLAPALSLERVRIDYDGRFLLVSPMRRDRFIADLQARVAAIRERQA
jgi:hypothetical protein